MEYNPSNVSFDILVRMLSSSDSLNTALEIIRKLGREDEVNDPENRGHVKMLLSSFDYPTLPTTLQYVEALQSDTNVGLVEKAIEVDDVQRVRKYIGRIPRQEYVDLTIRCLRMRKQNIALILLESNWIREVYMGDINDVSECVFITDSVKYLKGYIDEMYRVKLLPCLDRVRMMLKKVFAVCAPQCAHYLLNRFRETNIPNLFLWNEDCDSEDLMRTILERYVEANYDGGMANYLYHNASNLLSARVLRDREDVSQARKDEVWLRFASDGYDKIKVITALIEEGLDASLDTIKELILYLKSEDITINLLKHNHYNYDDLMNVSGVDSL